MFNINFANDWSRTADLWYRKRPLYQLSHNHNFKLLCYDSDRKTEKKCKKVCVEKVWVKPQSKFPKIFIVALSFLSIFPFLFYFIFSHFIAKEETQCLCKSGHGQ